MDQVDATADARWVTGESEQTDDAEVCGVCGTLDDLVDGHMVETPTGEICIRCWIDVTEAAWALATGGALGQTP
jgi:hypothetical protein